MRVHEDPRGTAVVRHVEAARLRLDVGPHPVGVGAGHRNRHLAQHAGREARIVRQFRPGLAAVRRLEDPRACSSAPQLPRLPVYLPESRVEHVGIAGIHDEIDGTRAVVAEQYLLPRPAAVGGTEHATVGIRTERMAEGGHVRPVRIGWVHPNAPNRLRVLQAEVAPAPPAVVGPIHAVALKHVRSQLHLAHADVDDVRVRLRDGHRPDGGASDLPVGHR